MAFAILPQAIGTPPRVLGPNRASRHRYVRGPRPTIILPQPLLDLTEDTAIDAVAWRALLDVQSTIQAAISAGTLTGLVGANVVIQKTPTDRAQSLPAVLLTLLSEACPPQSGTMQRDFVSYAILLSIVAADNQSQTLNWAEELLIRQNIRRLFHNVQLGSLTTENWICTVRPQTVVHQGAWVRKNLLLSQMVIGVTTREPRTQG
jgi:hypothetical protein